MRKMNDSGVSYLGAIPENWKKIKIKYTASERNEKGEFQANNDKYIGLENVQSYCDYLIDTESKYEDSVQSVCRKKDVLFGKLRPYLAKAIIAPYDCYCSGEFLQLYNYQGDAKFLRYFMISDGFIDTVNSSTYGAKMPRANSEFILNMEMPFPSLPEQRAISAYLDRQCALIDSVTEKTKASIEEYKKLRQAVITQAVTKGVRGDRPMKDSGIEWIGEIPEEWDVVRLKFILSEIVDCPHETPNYTFDGDYYVIRTADEDYGFLRSDDNMYRLNDDEYQNRIRRLSLDKDDIVYGREGERWGLACLVPDSNKYCLGQRMMQFRCKTDTVFPLYLKWALNSWSVYIQGCFDTLGSTSPHVNISTIINYYIPMPCYEEQIELAEYMERKSTAINALITKKETFLAELEAYKKSLIYEYVTGKKEIQAC